MIYAKIKGIDEAARKIQKEQGWGFQCELVFYSDDKKWQLILSEWKKENVSTGNFTERGAIEFLKTNEFYPATENFFYKP
ncbi:hypothetical protein HN954_03495 [bacterium]|jgi:hypothetical protein|nr:hypothetical protein [bacterium]MBT6832242.1 hypothetical protein [bacterium]MBT6996467.1 hypothetical protein [bacterium]MBT7772285.1 hypothetical protein [bacterium]